MLPLLLGLGVLAYLLLGKDDGEAPKSPQTPQNPNAPPGVPNIPGMPPIPPGFPTIPPSIPGMPQTPFPWPPQGGGIPWPTQAPPGWPSGWPWPPVMPGGAPPGGNNPQPTPGGQTGPNGEPYQPKPEWWPDVFPYPGYVPSPQWPGGGGNAPSGDPTLPGHMPSPSPQPTGITGLDDMTFGAWTYTPGLKLAEFCDPTHPNCQTQAANTADFAASHPEIPVARVDVRNAPASKMAYNVTSVPTLIAFDWVNPKGRIVGLATKAQIEALFR